MSPTF
jgi:hypothetical protein